MLHEMYFLAQQSVLLDIIWQTVTVTNTNEYAWSSLIRKLLTIHHLLLWHGRCSIHTRNGISGCFGFAPGNFMTQTQQH